MIIFLNTVTFALYFYLLCLTKLKFFKHLLLVLDIVIRKNLNSNCIDIDNYEDVEKLDFLLKKGFF